MKRKTLAITLTTLFAVSALTGCGKKDDVWQNNSGTFGEIIEDTESEPTTESSSQTEESTKIENTKTVSSSQEETEAVPTEIDYDAMFENNISNDIDLLSFTVNYSPPKC